LEKPASFDDRKKPGFQSWYFIGYLKDIMKAGIFVPDNDLFF
jgi:hypothetical protein